MVVRLRLDQSDKRFSMWKKYTGRPMTKAVWFQDGGLIEVDRVYEPEKPLRSSKTQKAQDQRVSTGSVRKISIMNNNHFSAISSKYNYMHKPLHDAAIPTIIDKLELKPDDLLLDIGSATGQLAQLVWKQGRLKNPVTCVEPCQAFFEYLNKLEGIVPVMQTAEQTCDQLVQNQKQLQKVIIFGVVHYFDDIPKRLGQIIDHLNKDGILLIANPPRVGLLLPLTAGHLETLAQQEDSLEIIVSYVKSREDVMVEVTNVVNSAEVPKSRWYYMIRNRFWQFLIPYTEEELEESIQEIEKEKFEGVKEDQLITLQDKQMYIKITKK